MTRTRVEGFLLQRSSYLLSSALTKWKRELYVLQPVCLRDWTVADFLLHSEVWKTPFVTHPSSGLWSVGTVMLQV